MEVGQGPNWGCSAKEKKVYFSMDTRSRRRQFYFYLTFYFRWQKTDYMQIMQLKRLRVKLSL
jgi:hypothetical protein